MNLGLDFRRGQQTLPAVLEQMAARINVVFGREHNADGTHRNITAKTITTGSITEYARMQAQGTPIDQPFNATDYGAASPMTLTASAGVIVANSYALVGKQLLWAFTMQGGTLGGSPSGYVSVRIPGGLLPSRGNIFCSVAQCSDGAGTKTASILISLGDPLVKCYLNSSANFTLGSLYLYWVAAFWVQ